MKELTAEEMPTGLVLVTQMNPVEVAQLKDRLLAETVPFSQLMHGMSASDQEDSSDAPESERAGA